MANAVQASPIVFIDSRLPNLASFKDDLPPNAEVYLLDPSQDGLQQIIAALQNKKEISALHVITHGGPATLELGNLRLDAGNLAMHTDAFKKVGEALAENADLLFYGCNVAEGTAGLSFVEQIALLTGADVAASTDLTGSNLQHGNWHLESRTGAVEANVFSLNNFAGVLALPGARSATQGAEVFLGGNYIELGISAVGSFGTSGAKPAGFFGTSGSSAVGLSNDADGYDNGVDLRIDYFLPGSPEERWAIGYNGTTTGGYSQLSGSSGVTLTANAVTNQSAGDTLKATFSGTVGGILGVEQVVSFGVNDKFFLNSVTLTNQGSSTLTDVRGSVGFFVFKARIDLSTVPRAAHCLEPERAARWASRCHFNGLRRQTALHTGWRTGSSPASSRAPGGSTRT